MGFSSEEDLLISSYARPDATFNRNGFLFAALAPIFAFAGYGWVQNDIVALTLAFIALASFMLWYLAMSRQSTRVLTSICLKLETERKTKSASSR